MKNIRIEKFNISDCDNIITDYEISEKIKKIYESCITYTFFYKNKVFAIFCLRLFFKTKSIECCMTVSTDISKYTKQLIKCCKKIMYDKSFLYDSFVFFAIVDKNFKKNIRFLEFFGFEKYCIIEDNKQIMIFKKEKIIWNLPHLE